MSIQSYPIANLFEGFIKDSQKGRRLKQDGKKLKQDSVVNYAYCLKLLQLFDAHRGEPVSIRPMPKYSKPQLLSEKKYWKKFYTDFTAFLYKQGCFDNYVGSVIKCLRTFFNWLETDKMLPVGRFHKDFFVVHQEVPIITLMPEQLRYLIYDSAFEASLPMHLQRTKDIMVIGCTVALRYSLQPPCFISPQTRAAVSWKPMIMDIFCLCRCSPIKARSPHNTSFLLMQLVPFKTTVQKKGCTLVLH